MINVHFIWFGYWILKEWKTVKVQNYSVAAYLLFTQMIGPLKFWHVYCCHVYFISARFINICKPRTTVYPFWQTGPPEFSFYGSVLACLWASSEWWMQAGSIPCDQKSSYKLNLLLFEAVSPNRLPFYLDSPLHMINSLFSHLYLFQNSFLQKILELGFWYLKPIFLRIPFYWLQNFFL